MNVSQFHLEGCPPYAVHQISQKPGQGQGCCVMIQNDQAEIFLEILQAFIHALRVRKGGCNFGQAEETLLHHQVGRLILQNGFGFLDEFVIQTQFNRQLCKLWTISLIAFLLLC